MGATIPQVNAVFSLLQWLEIGLIQAVVGNHMHSMNALSCDLIQAPAKVRFALMLQFQHDICRASRMISCQEWQWSCLHMLRAIRTDALQRTMLPNRDIHVTQAFRPSSTISAMQSVIPICARLPWRCGNSTPGPCFGDIISRSASTSFKIHRKFPRRKSLSI